MMSETRRDLMLAVVVIAGASLGLAFVCVGLFVRMSPAIGHIIQNNAPELQATQSLLGAFAARWGEPVDSQGVKDIDKALSTLRDRSREDGKVTIGRLTDAVSRAQSGERGPLHDVVDIANAVTDANFAAMREADRDAQRLGSAGAWLSALGGLGVTLIGLAVFVRLERRVARPARELSRVLSAASRGDRHQRCRPLEGASELEQALASVNMLLDRLPESEKHEGESGPDDTMIENDLELAAALAATHGKSGSTGHTGVSLSAILDEGDAPAMKKGRAALLALLEREPNPTLLYDVTEGILASNERALELLTAENGTAFRQKIEEAGSLGAFSKGGEYDGVKIEALGHGLLLCQLIPPGS